MNESTVRTSTPSAAAGRPPVAGNRRAEAALILSALTLLFWIELVLFEGSREGLLGSLQRVLLILATGLPAVLHTAVCVGAPFAALVLALVSLRDGRAGRRASTVALAGSATLVALIVWAVLDVR